MQQFPTQLACLLVVCALQAIYYFRGAQAIWLQEKFLKVYAGSAATYTLRDNYRSHQPIIAVADSIRKHL